MVYSSSEVMAKETGKYCSKSIEVIPFGVDSEFLIPVNRLGRSILTIGTIKRLEHIYGIDTLIHAFAICVNSNPEVNMRLAITGDGRLKNDLIILAKGHGIEHLCEFTGSVAHAEIKRHLDELDIFVALSREESFGVAIIEAQSCGLPVVVSNAPGPKEIVKQEVSGFIVDKEDPEAAAQAISMLIRNESLRIEMGNSGRDIVLEKYDWKMNVCQMIEAYQSQIKE
jgi:L-malate glycosyltransferase